MQDKKSVQAQARGSKAENSVVKLIVHRERATDLQKYVYLPKFKEQPLIPKTLIPTRSELEKSDIMQQMKVLTIHPCACLTFEKLKNGFPPVLQS